MRGLDDLARRDRRILEGLVRIAGGLLPLTARQVTLADRLHVSLATLERSLAALRDAGCLTIARAGRGEAGTIAFSPRCRELLSGDRTSTIGEQRPLKAARILAGDGTNDRDVMYAAQQYLDIATEEERRRIEDLAGATPLEEMAAAQFLAEDLINRGLIMHYTSVRKRLIEKTRQQREYLRSRFIRE